MCKSPSPQLNHVVLGTIPRIVPVTIIVIPQVAEDSLVGDELTCVAQFGYGAHGKRVQQVRLRLCRADRAAGARRAREMRANVEPRA